MSHSNKVFSAEEWVRDQIHLVKGQDVPTLDFHGSSIPIDLPRMVTSIEAAQRYYDVLHSQDPEFPALVVEESEESRRVKSRPHHWTGNHRKGVITFSRGQDPCDELLLLHEAAHALSNNHHGDLFWDAYLSLVNRHIGPGVGLLLTVARNSGKRNERQS